MRYQIILIFAGNNEYCNIFLSGRIFSFDDHQTEPRQWTDAFCKSLPLSLPHIILMFNFLSLFSLDFYFVHCVPCFIFPTLSLFILSLQFCYFLKSLLFLWKNNYKYVGGVVLYRERRWNYIFHGKLWVLNCITLFKTYHRQSMNKYGCKYKIKM